jgi:tail assembly chaperone
MAAMNKWLWMISPDATPTDVDKWAAIRRHRDELLSASDWTQLNDAVMTSEEKLAWSAYRQALRDIPQDFDNPEDVVFPEVPNG